MFARITSFAIFLFFALPILAAASAIPRDDDDAPPPPPPPTSSCSTGSVNCCNSLQDSTSSLVGLLSGLLGIVLGPITGQVGLTCSPLLLGSTNCANQVACCTGNTFNGLITLGCSPLNIGL